MNELCRSFCPVAESCVRRHEELQQVLDDALEKEREVADARDSLASSIDVNERTITFGTIALSLVRSGDYKPPDPHTYINETLDSIRDNTRRMTQNTADHAELTTVFQNHKTASARARQEHATSRALITRVNEAQQECFGPALTLAGKLKFGKAVVQAWIFSDTPAPREANKRYLFRQGYAKCPKLPRQLINSPF